MSPETEQVIPDFGKLLDFIKNSRGFDFTGYKTGSLQRRILKRMNAVEITAATDYIDYLEVHPEEFEQLFNGILINVTSFFRDDDSWECIANDVIPAILASKIPGEPIRIWSAGCASGEEAYTVAMLLAEAVGVDKLSKLVKIYATDADEVALATGRRAVYSAAKLAELPEAMKKYFQPVGPDYTVCQELRRVVIFGRHDLVQDAPISRIDLLICRNTLMYFNSETQARILNRFHYALQSKGFPFVGKAEMLATPNNLFVPSALKYRVFTKSNRITPARPAAPGRDSGADGDILDITDPGIFWQSAFDSMPVAQVILDKNGYLLMANQQARSMFNLVMTDIGRPLQDLEMSYRPLELRSVIERALATGQPIVVSKVEKSLGAGKTQYLDIQVSLLSDIGGISISFTDVTSFEKLKDNFKRALRDLETTNQELQSAQEELETTNEELQSTNEELETTNEELQSSNEELETMNEELASTNDELEAANSMLGTVSKTVNQDKTFLESVLASTSSAIIALDGALNVKLWNYRAQDLWGLRAEEVLGCKLTTLDIGLPPKEIADHISSCIAAGLNSDKFTIDAVNRKGKKIVIDVKITAVKQGTSDPVSAFVLTIDESNSSH